MDSAFTVAEGYKRGERRVDGARKVYVAQYLVREVMLNTPMVVAVPLNEPGCSLVSLDTWRGMPTPDEAFSTEPDPKRHREAEGG